MLWTPEVSDLPNIQGRASYLGSGRPWAEASRFLALSLGDHVMGASPVDDDLLFVLAEATNSLPLHTYRYIPTWVHLREIEEKHA